MMVPIVARDCLLEMLFITCEAGNCFILQLTLGIQEAPPS